MENLRQYLPWTSLMLTNALVFASCLLLYNFLLTVYRIFLHPLAKFPGPKLAATSYWYEYYYDVVLPGKYLWKIKELHQIYGPIVRVNPNEVHINDPDFYGEIYHSKAYKTNRDAWYFGSLFGDAIAFTIEHHLHAHRRSAISPYFSARSIQSLENRIRTPMSAMERHFREAHKFGTILNATHLCAALSMDVASEFFLGPEQSTGYLSRAETGRDFNEIIRKSLPLNNVGRQFPPLMRFLFALPDWLVLKMNPGAADMFAWKRHLAKMIRRKVDETLQAGADQLHTKEERTIIDELVTSELPREEKRPQRLIDEADQVVSAGGVTTGEVMSRTLFYILQNPSVLLRLQRELSDALPHTEEVPSQVAVQQLPYLNAVIEEGLRLSFPITARMPRVFQDHALQFNEWSIPPGSTISQSSYIVLPNASIFPDPMSFKPERWLDNKKLLKYQVVFSKGRRACLGLNLAYAELRLFIATVFRKFDMTLFDTTGRDAAVVHDYFVGCTAPESQGIRVKVVGVRT